MSETRHWFNPGIAKFKAAIWSRLSPDI